MLPNYLISVPDAALHRADYFRQHNSDPRNEASESPYRSNLPHSLGAWSEDDLLLCIRRWAPRARWLLIDRDIYGPGFSLAHQLFPGANSQRLTDVNAMIARLLPPERRKALSRRRVPWLSLSSSGELTRSTTRSKEVTSLAALRVDTTNMERPAGSAPGTPSVALQERRVARELTLPSAPHPLLIQRRPNQSSSKWRPSQERVQVPRR